MLRLLSRIKRRGRDLGVRLHLIPYRRHWVMDAQDWDREYASGKLDHYGGFPERARYGVLRAFLTARTGPIRLLDFGCGIGILKARTRDLNIEEFVGIDPSQTAIDAARATYGASGRFLVADHPDPELGKFDVIVCNEVLYYVEDLAATLARLRDALADGGWLLTSIVRHPGDIALHRALADEFEIVDSIFVKRQLPPRNGWTVACYAKPSAPELSI